jgi:hypothetical protein
MFVLRQGSEILEVLEEHRPSRCPGTLIGDRRREKEGGGQADRP